MAACLLILASTGCSPSAPTPHAEAVIEDPPQCWGADLIYHPQLQQMLLVNCIDDPHDMPYLTIWGWDGIHWQRVAEGGPPGRLLGAAAYDEKRNVLVVYGGRQTPAARCSPETWEWDGETWSLRDAKPPTACDHIRMVYDRASGESILFSGLDRLQGRVDETWSWNGEEWTLLSEDGPRSRGHFGFAYDPHQDQILMYGGLANTVTDDFWTWKDGIWHELSSPGPGRLSHFGMTYDTDAHALYIFGGATETSTFTSLTNTTWAWREGTWQKLRPAYAPSPRGTPAMGYDPVRKRIVFYGGFNADRQNLGDTWEWDGQGWVCMSNCD
jgi:hypothetical protein